MRKAWGILPVVVSLLVLALGVPGVAQGASGSAQAQYGKTVYRVYCASCHGAEAQGDGQLAQYLTVKPTDLTKITKKNDGVFPEERMERIIDGREQVRGHAGEMPVWGDAFQKADALENEPPDVREREVGRKIAALVSYIESVQVEGMEGEGMDDMDDMEEMDDGGEMDGM